MKKNNSNVNSVLVKYGKIIDGSGNPWFKGDILIEKRLSRSSKKNLRITYFFLNRYAPVF